MKTKDSLLIFFAILFLLATTVVGFQYKRIERLTAERERYKGNTEVLFGEVKRYRVSDSLNAARVEALELTAKEYERFRAEDARLIQSLRQKNRDLSAVNKAQSRTILSLSSVPRDTVIVVDSVRVPAVAVHCGDPWYDFDGVLTETAFTGTLVSRDSLVLVESVRYRRFLGFLWKTHRVQDRRLDCLSKNPHTEILGLEHIIVEN